jgi:hypothetical protein
LKALADNIPGHGPRLLYQFHEIALRFSRRALAWEDLQGLGYFGQTYERNNRRNNGTKDHKTAALAAALLLSPR